MTDTVEPRDSAARPRAVVWIADGEPRRGIDYGRRVEQALQRDGFDVMRRSLPDGELTPISAELHVFTGGATSANADCSWMRDALALMSTLLKGAERGEHAVFGICLGAQMIAAASAPGSVVAGTTIEVGLGRVVLDGSTTVRVAQFHYEQIDEGTLRRSSARIVARSDHTAVQAFRRGAHVMGTQFHPELEPDDLRALILEHRATIELHGGSVAAAASSIDAHEHEWSADLFPDLLQSVLVQRAT